MEPFHHIQIQRALIDIGTSLQRIEHKLNEGPSVKNDWLDSQDICKMLQISKRTLDSYREKGLLPFSKIGGKVFYRAKDIEDYLRTHIGRRHSNENTGGYKLEILPARPGAAHRSGSNALPANHYWRGDGGPVAYHRGIVVCTG